MSYWFFGNPYEQIVIAPNWVVNSVEQIRRFNEFFINMGAAHYLVPLTQKKYNWEWFKIVCRSWTYLGQLSRAKGKTP